MKNHLSHGAGVYSYFRDHYVKMDTGIKAPSGSGIKFDNAFNKMLSGQGGISHVLNGEGGSAFNQGISYLCGYHAEQNTDLVDEEIADYYDDAYNFLQ